MTKGKTIIQGYVLANNSPSQSIANGYYFRVSNGGAVSVNVQISNTGKLVELAPGAAYEFNAGDPHFPFDEQQRITVSATGNFIVNLIVAYVKYE